MKNSLLLFLFLSIVVVVYAENVQTSWGTVKGEIIGNQIFYQDKNFINIPNIVNPVQVSISMESTTATTTNANLCFNPHQEYYPVSGVQLEYTCPNGGYVSISNSTKTISPSFKTQRVKTARTQRLSKLAEDTTTGDDVYVMPSQHGGFVANFPSVAENVTLSFEITYSWSYCASATEYPIGANNTCVEIEELTTAAAATPNIQPNSWVYYYFDTTTFNSTVLDYFTFYQNYTKKIDMYVQSGYLPTSTWNLQTIVADDDDGGEYQYIYTPSRYVTSSERFFVGLYNTDSDPHTVSVSVNITKCTSPTSFGIDCGVSTTTGYDPTKFIYSLSANVSSSSSIVSFDNYTDSDQYGDAIAYFSIVDLPATVDGSSTYFIRVSTGNNNLGKYDFPPPLIAKLNGYPSLQSFDYNVSVGHNSEANQLSLPITDSANDNWIIGVVLPASFTIWVGSNCAYDCNAPDAKSSGTCLCSYSNSSTGSACNDATTYSLPYGMSDSVGICTCTDENYSGSFDCSEKPNYHIPYLILLALIGVCAIAVAIAFPVYRYVKKNKRANDGYDPM